MSQKIVLASSNSGKLKELAELLADFNWDVINQSDLGVESAPEPAVTFVENALIKARHACASTGLPSISDDSGLVVCALDNQPGVRSARFSGEHATAQSNMELLLHQLTDIPPAQRQAFFVSVCVYMRSAEDPSPIITQGIWHGQILLEPLGHYGFGYDPVFYVPTHHCSAAQLDPEIKNQISHRGQAMQQLRENLTACLT